MAPAASQSHLARDRTELDARLFHLRARLLEALALHSAATAWQDAPPPEQPRCPDCGPPLQQRGTQSRTLQPHGGHDRTLLVGELAREYGFTDIDGQQPLFHVGA